MEGLLALIVLLAIYLAPSVVAAVREHPHRNAIIALNILTGWTFVGRVAALIWGTADPAAGSREQVKRPAPRPPSQT